MISIVTVQDRAGARTFLWTRGLDREGKPELVLVSLPVMSEAPLRLLYHLMETLGREAESHDFGDGEIVSVGDYGHMRLQIGTKNEAREVLLLRDVEEKAESANDFVGRLMALVGLEHLEREQPAAA